MLTRTLQELLCSLLSLGTIPGGDKLTSCPLPALGPRLISSVPCLDSGTKAESILNHNVDSYSSLLGFCRQIVIFLMLKRSEKKELAVNVNTKLAEHQPSQKASPINNSQ